MCLVAFGVSIGLLQTVSALAYVTKSLNLSVTEISLQHTWQCAVSHIFNVSGQNVNFVRGIMDDKSLDVQVIMRYA